MYRTSIYIFSKANTILFVCKIICTKMIYNIMICKIICNRQDSCLLLSCQALFNLLTKINQKLWFLILLKCTEMTKNSKHLLKINRFHLITILSNYKRAWNQLSNLTIGLQTSSKMTIFHFDSAWNSKETINSVACNGQ